MVPAVKIMAVAVAAVVISAVLFIYLSPDYSWDSSVRDTDGDGYADANDAFPDEPTEWFDSDDDGTGDNSDEFLDDASEQTDTDDDGVGDNSDEFPEDPEESTDSDDDGVGDNEDEFPDDPEETDDTDNDGMGDNTDEFPDDPEEWVDSDGDGVGDNSDDYPDDPTQWEAETPTAAIVRTTIANGVRITIATIEPQVSWTLITITLTDGTDTATWTEIDAGELDDGVAAISDCGTQSLGSIEVNLTAFDVVGDGEIGYADFFNLVAISFFAGTTYTVQIVYELTGEPIATMYFTG